MVVRGTSIHDTHVMNNVRLLCLEVSDEESPLQPPLVLCRGPFDFVLPSTHSATCVYFVVITNVSGGEGLVCKVKNPITELVVMRRDDASLLSIKGVADVRCCATSITMVR